jgi:diguanylate cyclase (GGDEF)-like protein
MVVPGWQPWDEPPAGTDWSHPLARPVTVAALTMAGILPGRPGAGPLTPGALLGLCAALTAAGSLRLCLRHRGEVYSLELFEPMLLVAVYAMPGRLALALTALAASLAQGLRRTPPAGVAFSAARWSCAAGAGSLVFVVLRDGTALSPRNLLALLGAMLTVTLTSQVAAPPARVPPRWPALALGLAAKPAASALLLASWVLAPVVTPLLLVALALVRWAALRNASLRARHAQLAGVQRATGALGVPVDPREAIPRFLATVRDCFQATAAELVVVDGRQRVAWRSCAGVPAAARRSELVEWDTLAAVLVNLDAVGWLRSSDPDAAGATQLRREGWRDCLAAPVRSGARSVGALAVYDPGDAGGLRRGEPAALELLAAAAGAALDRAGRLDAILQERTRLAQLVERSARDLTERRRAERLLAGRAHVLGLIAGDAPLMATLSALARFVEAEAEGGRCAVLLLDGDGGTLTVAAAPNLVDAVLHQADGLVVGPLAGSSGTAVHRQEAVLVSDVASAPLWAPTRQAALARGLRAAWAMPITSAQSGQVRGTVTVYFDRPRAAGPSDLRLLEAAADLAGVAVERSHAQARLAHQAAHDALTGLPNRVFFLDRAANALARTRRSRFSVAVLFCDVDRFKAINDSLGHEAGDRLLRELARRLREVVRPGDTVARFGGDEFTILCDSIADEAHALAIAERVGHVAAAPFALGGAEVLVTMSVGIALGSGPHTRPEALIENADAAMYRAKARGGNRREVFDRDMRARSRRRLALHSALHRAVEHGELRVFYQPIVCLRTRRPVGAEALVRWQHPERGLVGPEEFIGLAEETGLSVPIGTQVLREACLRAGRWRSAGQGRPPPCVKVNLSARQFTHPNLIATVAGILAETGVDPARVYLEITESVLMDDAESTGTALDELKSLGVSLAVDHFGTGSSSLRHLKRFPVDELKVDRTLVTGLLGNAEDGAVVAAAVNLAHTLGLKAVADGVDSSGQLTRLRELGCDMGQGDHLGQPLPADSIAPHLGLTPPADGRCS